MNKFFQKRLSKHLLEMTRYLRYVLNDFFILALMFFVGGLGLAYSNLLKTLHFGVWWSKPLTFIIILLVSQVGGFATLFEKADKVFLLPRELDLRKYLKEAFRYSLILALIPQVLVWFIMLPFLKVTQGLSMTNLILLLVFMVILKIIVLQYKYFNSYQLNRNDLRGWFAKWGIPVLLTYFNVYNLGFYILILSFAILLGQQFAYKKAIIGPLAWNHLIDSEDHRMHRIYQFFNMFTDVPQLDGRVRRRRYLNPILQRLSGKMDRPYLYLYLRGMVRDTETSGLYIRLTLIGGLILALLNGFWLPLIISALFIYLIGFQLIPFYFHFIDNVFTHVYPLDQKLQLKSFQKVIQWLLCTTTILFTIASFVTIKAFSLSGLILVIDGIESILIVKAYLPRRIKKEIKSL